MRTREEIEKDFVTSRSSMDTMEGATAVATRVTVELLLDIRDLLQANKSV